MCVSHWLIAAPECGVSPDFGVSGRGDSSLGCSAAWTALIQCLLFPQTAAEIRLIKRPSPLVSAPGHCGCLILLGWELVAGAQQFGTGILTTGLLLVSRTIFNSNRQSQAF